MHTHTHTHTPSNTLTHRRTHTHTHTHYRAAAAKQALSKVIVDRPTMVEVYFPFTDVKLEFVQVSE